MRRLLFLILLPGVITSCGSNQRSENLFGGDVMYDIVKVDSFDIPRENAVRILDFNESKRNYLGYDVINEEFVVLDYQGKELNSIKLQGEGPDEYNSLLTAASFSQDEEGYFLQSAGELIKYDTDWHVIERIKFSPKISVFLYSGPRFKVPYFMGENGTDFSFFASFFSGFSFHQFEKNEVLQEQKLLEYYSTSAKDLKSDLSLDMEYFNDSELEAQYFRPIQIFHLDQEEGLLYLTFKNSSILGIYDIFNGFELVSKISLDHESFLASNQARNVGVYKLDKHTIVLVYFMGKSEGEIQNLMDSNPDYLAHKDPACYSIMVVSLEGQERFEIAFPEEAEPHSEILSFRDGKLLMRIRESVEVEQDYSRYAIYELRRQED
ncbi:hypothetical protein MM239_00270 [Belliella sp. DSM 111904]|uniref:TolB-like 6-blade propeller-like n=1 Tax=Belliella filtrata TaxID=2923435 RepID=A0ABS9UVJ0_9BACT|nr:hypothetical protein [Belliella filtrata]MCH7407813.1 hypothetical protein [Belliella filtrata]